MYILSLLTVLDRYIAVSSEDGRIKVFNDCFELLHTARYLAGKISEISFMTNDDQIDSEYEGVFLLLAYKCGTLVLTEYDGRLNELMIIQDVKLHCVYKKFLCYEKRGGRITISKLQRTGYDWGFSDVTFVRIYSPTEVTCFNIWKGTATFLINSEVKILKYDKKNIPPVSLTENKVRINFCLKCHTRLDRVAHIYNNDIIITLSRSDLLTEQILELFILGPEEQYSKKLFNSWDILQSYVTCMFLYGSIFVLGVDIGNVYFYNVTSWKTFNLRNYQHKEILGKHPIIGIDVKETKGVRKFYVTSSFNIHEIVGFQIPKCFD